MPLPVPQSWQKKPVGTRKMVGELPPISSMVGERKSILGAIEQSIRDPELLDVLRQYKIIHEDLVTHSATDRIEVNVFSLCELSREATLRLTPFATDELSVIQFALTQYRASLHILRDKPTSVNIAKYTANIEKRVQDYERYLEEVKTKQETSKTS
jgi:hypothetical protein